MKKIILILIAVMLSTATFAQTTNTDKSDSTLEKWSAKIGGFTQLRAYSNQGHSSYAELDRIALDMTVKAPDKSVVYGCVYFQHYLDKSKTKYYLESLYYDMPAGENNKLRLGKGRNQNFGIMQGYSNRRTSEYGILAEVFTQDRIIGAQYNTKLTNDVSAGFNVYMGPSIAARATGSSPDMEKSTSVPHFAERDDPYNETGNPTLGLRLTSKPVNNLTLGVSGALGSLKDSDINFINKYYSTSDKSDTYYKYGVDASYRTPKYNVIFETYYGKYSTLGILGLGLTADYTINKYGTRVAAKYSYLDYNKTPIASVPMTWEPRQLILGLIHPINKNILLETNYAINQEKGGSSDNNLAFIECMISF